MIFLALAAALAAPHAKHPVHARHVHARPTHARVVHRKRITVRHKAAARAPAAPAIFTTASGLRIQTVKPGTRGQRAGPMDTVVVTYVGRLADGREFDRSDQPVPMPISGVVPGFGEAPQLMDKGGTYRIWLPPKLAYGEKGAGGGVIPPNATLEFDVAVLDIVHAPAGTPQG